VELRVATYAFITLILISTVCAITETFTVTVPDLDFWESDGLHHFRIDGYGSMNEHNMPHLPTKTVFYEIPDDAIDIRVALESAVSNTISGIDSIEESKQILPAIGNSSRITPYTQPTGIYPAKLYKFSGIRNLNGRKLVAITLYPVRYVEDQRQVEHTGEYVFRISYTLPPRMAWISKTQDIDGPSDMIASDIVTISIHPYSIQ